LRLTIPPLDLIVQSMAAGIPAMYQPMRCEARSADSRPGFGPALGRDSRWISLPQEHAARHSARIREPGGAIHGSRQSSEPLATGPAPHPLVDG